MATSHVANSSRPATATSTGEIPGAPPARYLGKKGKVAEIMYYSAKFDSAMNEYRATIKVVQRPGRAHLMPSSTHAKSPNNLQNLSASCPR
jgi:hypothetical protein